MTLRVPRDRVSLIDALTNHAKTKQQLKQIDLEGCYTADEAMRIAWVLPGVRVGGYEDQALFGYLAPTCKGQTKKDYFIKINLIFHGMELQCNTQSKHNIVRGLED